MTKSSQTYNNQCNYDWITILKDTLALTASFQHTAIFSTYVASLSIYKIALNPKSAKNPFSFFTCSQKNSFEDT